MFSFIKQFFGPPAANGDGDSRLADTKDGFPNTFPAEGKKAQSTPRIFEPALRHFPNAFRLGVPFSFTSPELKRAWQQAEALALGHFLKLIAASRWNENLVLRGSLLMKAWLGPDARQPHDMDWVFRQKEVGTVDFRSLGLFQELREMGVNNPSVGDVQFSIDKIAEDDIWTYERAEGHRIVFPWASERTPPGEVQVDVCFNEELYMAPVCVEIPIADGARVWAATPEVSLAWKIKWLVTDSYPQGKDLYDAVMLAERFKVSKALLEQVAGKGLDEWFGSEGERRNELHVDWENFVAEYPHIQATGKEWFGRLCAALKPALVDRVTG